MLGGVTLYNEKKIISISFVCFYLHNTSNLRLPLNQGMIIKLDLGI